MTKKVQGVTINVFTEQKQVLGLNTHDIEEILSKLPSSTLDHFRSFQIIFLEDKHFQETLTSGKKIRFANNLSAFVNTDEIKEGLHKIYVRIDFIIFNLLTEPKSLTQLSTNSSLNKQLKEKLLDDIIHELTHLWHLRINNIKDIAEKNKSRIYHAEKKIISSFDSLSHELFLGKWMSLRIKIIEIIEFIIVEGIADFVKLFENNTYVFSEQSVKKSHKLAYSEAEDLDFTLRNFYAYFESILKELSSKKISPEDFEKNISILFKKYMNEKIIHSLKQYGYIIGPHIYHLLLYDNKDMSLEKLAKEKPHTLLKLYVKACKHNGLKPLVSFNDDAAVFCYGVHVRLLGKIGK
jgi:hypothetical protein